MRSCSWKPGQSAMESFNLNEVSKRVGSEVLAKAELDALKSEIEVLSAQIREYEVKYGI